MTGEKSSDGKPEAQIPTALVAVADEEGLSVRQALMLLKMQHQIIAHRKGGNKNVRNGINWREF